MSDFVYRNPDRKPNPPLFPWLDEHVDFLKKRWAAGDSAATIAKALSGPSRNAVIGKAHRLGLSERKTKTRTPYPQRAVRTRLPRHAGASRRISKLKTEIRIMGPLPMPPQHADDVARVSLLDLEPHHCRWPVGEPTQGFCGCAKVPGLSYCASHAARAYNGTSGFTYAAKTPALGVAQHAAADEFLKQQEPVA